MKSDILSPEALFQKSVRYHPTFQRPYIVRTLESGRLVGTAVG
jgi:hypothetical protein